MKRFKIFGKEDISDEPRYLEEISAKDEKHALKLARERHPYLQVTVEDV